MIPSTQTRNRVEYHTALEHSLSEGGAVAVNAVDFHFSCPVQKKMLGPPVHVP